LQSNLPKIAYSLFLYGVAICVLVTAVAVTIIRLALPDIGSYRSEIEAWVSRYTGLPVVIRSIEAEWSGWIPRLYLEDIELLDKTGKNPVIHFREAQVNIAPLSSLLNRRIIPRQLIISGFRISVTQMEDGSILIRELNRDMQTQEDNSGDDLTRWLISQTRIVLRDVDIEWLDVKYRQDPVALSDVTLLLRSDGERLQIEGSALLPAEYGQELGFAFDSYGNLLSPDWSGELYLHAKNVNPDGWYPHSLPAGTDITGGNTTLSVWTTWENARLAALAGRVEMDDFSAEVNGTGFHIETLDSRFEGRQDELRNWRFDVHLDNFITGNGPWPATDLAILIHPSAGGGLPRYTASFSYLDLADVIPLAMNMPLTAGSGKFPAFTGQYEMDGKLSGVRISYLPETGTFRCESGFHAVRIKDKRTGTEFLNLSGTVTATPGGGSLSFNRDAAQISLPGLGLEAIKLSAIDGELAWQYNEEGFTLGTGNLQLAGAGLTARVSGSIDMPKDSPPFIDARFALDDADLETVIDHMPFTPEFKARNWLQKSVSGGRLASTRAVFRGSLKDFPFDGNEGRFTARAKVADTLLKYSPQWPAIHINDADLAFEGRKLVLDNAGGKIFNAGIKNAFATLPDFISVKKLILVNGEIDAGTDDLGQFIRQSPLGRDVMVSKVSDSLSEGRLGLELDLSIPFRNPGEPLKVNGKARLEDGVVTSDLSSFKLTGVTGTATFTRTSLLAENLSARFGDQDVRLSVRGSKDNPADPPAVIIAGRGDETFIAEQVSGYFPGLDFVHGLLSESLAGNTAWEAALMYRQNRDSGQLDRLLRVRSDLQGLAVRLPPPLDKQANESVELLIERELDNPAGAELAVRYGPILSSRLQFESLSNNALKSATIVFGDRAGIPDPGEGIRLSGTIDRLSVDDWLAFLKPFGWQTGATPVTVTDLLFGDLHSTGQSFTNTLVSGGTADSGWQFALAGDAIHGTLDLPAAGNEQGIIRADLEHLHLQALQANEKQNMKPASIPPISAEIGSFRYNGNDLGKLALSTSPAGEGLSIDHLSLEKPELLIEAAGNWKDSEHNGSSSDFTIDVRAERFGAILETFGYGVAPVINGKTRLSINANWLGSPADFSLDRLNGTLKMRITRGQLVDVKATAGRLFGLLSIQTLPRRLSLDFSDLFGKGLAFDRIEGNFIMEDGDAYTNNLHMTGPSVDVKISGRTGLSEQDYDQRAVVVPQIANSLPVTGALFGPVGIGLGAILYLTGKMFDPIQTNINKLLMVEYSITGSWDDPIVEKYRLEPEEPVIKSSVN